MLVVGHGFADAFFGTIVSVVTLMLIATHKLYNVGTLFGV
jgi:hypothetical protein